MAAAARFFGIEVKPADGGADSKAGAAIAEAFAILKPRPSPRPLIRIGPDDDGAYLVPDDLDGIAACFSPGISDFKHFEDALTTHFGIPCHMCDFSSDAARLRTPLIAGRQTFRKSWLDVTGRPDSISLTDWVNELAPGNGDLLLQMDIEGAEYRNILACPATTLARFRIIAIELHGLAALLDDAVRAQVLLPFLRKLDRQFACIHAHPNNSRGQIILPGSGANLPDVLELTFLRRDRLHGEAQAALLPHPEDIAANAPGMPPLFLNEAWLDGPRAPASTVRMLEAELGFHKARAAYLEVEWSRMVVATAALNARAAATPVAEFDGLDEVAAGRGFALSSAFAGMPATGIVPEEAQDFFFHTGFGVDQSITVDLGAMRTVRAIAIGNRRDACRDRARLLFLILHTETASEGGAVFFLPSPPDFLAGVAEAQLTVPPTRARYVTIRSPMHSALHFASLRVFAEPVAAAPPAEKPDLFASYDGAFRSASAPRRHRARLDWQGS